MKDSQVVSALLLVLPIFAPLPNGNLNSPGTTTVLIEEDEVEVRTARR